jgi:hypothetical protein
MQKDESRKGLPQFLFCGHERATWKAVQNGGQMNQAENSIVVLPPQHEEPTTQTTTGRGARDMRLAADMVLDEKCIELARALAKSAIEGHVHSARFLFALADGQRAITEGEMKRQLSSTAIVLDADPQWVPERTEETAELGSGGPEPEA